MIKRENDSQNTEFPHYSIAEIMALLEKEESKVRNLLQKAGIETDVSKKDPHERIQYEDFCKLWASLVNRREGRLLSTMLLEGPGNWWTNLLGKRN